MIFNLDITMFVHYDNGLDNDSKQNMVCRNKNLRLITKLFFPQSSGNMFFTTLFERKMFSALFSLSTSWKYRECDGKKEIKITSYTSAYTQKGTTGIHPASPLHPICATTAPSRLVPLPMKNKQVPKHSIRSHWNLFIAKIHKNGTVTEEIRHW